MTTTINPVNKLTIRQINKILRQWAKEGDRRVVNEDKEIHFHPNPVYGRDRESVFLRFVVKNFKTGNYYWGHFEVFMYETGDLKVVLDDESKEVLKVNIPHFKRLSLALDILECGVEHFW